MQDLKETYYNHEEEEEEEEEEERRGASLPCSPYPIPNEVLRRIWSTVPLECCIQLLKETLKGGITKNRCVCLVLQCCSLVLHCVAVLHASCCSVARLVLSSCCSVARLVLQCCMPRAAVLHASCCSVACLMLQCCTPCVAVLHALCCLSVCVSIHHVIALCLPQ